MKHPLAERLRRTYHTADLPEGNPIRQAADELDQLAAVAFANQNAAIDLMRQIDRQAETCRIDTEQIASQQVLLARALEALSEPTPSGHCDSVHAQLRVDLMRALGLFDDAAPLRYPHDDMGTPT